jgi:membrane-associated phospholipid phosphatase
VSTLERAWITYLLCVLAVAGLTPGGGDAALQRWGFLALHAGLLLLHLSVAAWDVRVGPIRTRPLRCAAALVSLPAVFSSLGWILPALQPEPWEWTWLQLDRALFATDPTVAVQVVLFPALTELLQWCYASFYLLPVAACLCVGRARGAAAFDRALTIVVAGFLGSYLGYLLFPTLPPYRFLEHGSPLQGIWIAEELNRLLYQAEANRWDCFPSGHTMMTLVSLVLVARWARGWLWVFGPVGGLLVFSTVALRYHWVVDVAAGAALVWPAIRLTDRLLDRDLAPPA